MQNIAPSEKYAIAAALGLLFMLLTNNALLMLVLSVLGLVAGLWVFRQGDVRRVAFVAFMAFTLAAVFAVIGLVRAA
jgi:uncharacterized membrane protein YozB (DUF420 family)